MSQNFDDFLTSKYSISRTVYPISMIFLQTTQNFIPCPNLNKNVKEILKISIEIEIIIFDQKTAKLATVLKLALEF